MQKILSRCLVGVALIATLKSVYAQSKLPDDFVYLKDVDPTIVQEMRYAGYHNFVGKPVKGYDAAECILTRDAAMALKKVQAELKKSSFSLKVYDCYRPQKAVNEFIAWSQDPTDQSMKAEFYADVNKADVFKLGYVAEKSGHSRGSTVDLTIIPIPAPKQPKYHVGQKLISCVAPVTERFHDNSIDMGTGYDCFNDLAHIDAKVSEVATAHRQMFQQVMTQNGFQPYENEWWHFTLKNEPHPDTYFNFDIK